MYFSSVTQIGPPFKGIHISDLDLNLKELIDLNLKELNHPYDVNI